MQRRAARVTSALRTPSSASGPRRSADEPLDALHLLLHRPEAVVEDDAAELVVARVERLLLVLLPEEARVGEARAHHAVGALA